MPAGIPLFVAWVLVVQAVIVTYDGWYGAFYFGDEMINPGVELPRSMINGVLLLSAIYIFTNAALFYVFDAPTLARENLPIAAVGQMILGERGPVIVRSFMTITLVSVTNASVLCATRILYAMSRDGWDLRPHRSRQPRRHAYHPALSLHHCERWIPALRIV